MEKKSANRQYIKFDIGDLGDDRSAVLGYFHALKSAAMAIDKNSKYLEDKFFMDQAKRWWAEQKREHRKAGVCDVIKKIMVLEKIKEVERFVDEAVITQKEFVDSMFCLRHHGYLYKFEKNEIIPSDLEGKRLPRFAHVQNGKVDSAEGEHDLTDGQIKHLIQNRKVMHIHSLEKDDRWYCFYFAFSDVQGAHWKTGHLHYSRNSWYKDLNGLVDELKLKRHSARSVHIKFILTPNED